jgi:DNA primase large subunit
MENLHDELRRNKHLKHWGRIQYGLFLKGIGLSLEQALIFWQIAFEKLTPDQFTKQYAYNIRHSYGLEGKRTDYTPHR